LEFLIWACRVLHVFGVVVWLGGLMFQNAVVHPLGQTEGAEVQSATLRMYKRFVNFVWMSVWTIGVTGVLMMLFNPKFVWFQYNDRWSTLLGIKQVIFFLMMFYAFGYARMLHYILAPASNGGFDEKAETYGRKIHQFRTINIFLGIVALLLASGMTR
jgi:uncharacterized membrane protein